MVHTNRESDMHQLSNQGVPHRFIMTTSGNNSFESTKIGSGRTPSTTVVGSFVVRRRLCRRQKKKNLPSLRQNGEACKLAKPLALKSILFVSWRARGDPRNIQISQQCKLQGHVGTAIQALGLGLDWATCRSWRCPLWSGFARSRPHPRAGLLMYSFSVSAGFKKKKRRKLNRKYRPTKILLIFGFLSPVLSKKLLRTMQLTREATNRSFNVETVKEIA